MHFEQALLLKGISIFDKILLEMQFSKSELVSINVIFT